MAIDAERLIELEKKYGGRYVVPGRNISPLMKTVDNYECHEGGDRMGPHGYAEHYAKVLPKTPDVIVEMGILRGTGLALWSELYPGVKLVGLDINVNNFMEHKDELLAKGAFKARLPVVLPFDEFDMYYWDSLATLLPRNSVDVWIDDAVHETGAILNAFELAYPFMYDRSVYIIEDNEEAGAIIRDTTGLTVYTEGQFTAVEICR